MVAARFDPVRNVVETDQPLLDGIDDERASSTWSGQPAAASTTARARHETLSGPRVTIRSSSR